MTTKKHIYPVFLAAALPIVLDLILILWFGFSSEQKRAEDLMQSYTESVANGVYSFFVDAAAVAAAASTLHSAQDFDWQVAGDDFTGFMRSERIKRFVRRISLVDSNGYVYDAYETGPVGNRWQGGRRTENNSDPNSEPVVVTDRDYFRILVKENKQGAFSILTHEPFVPDGMTEKALITSAPIIKEGKSIGVVSVSQTMLELSHLYEDLTMDFLDKFGSKAHLFLVSQEGQILSNLDYNETYGTYMDKLFGRGETLSVAAELGENVVSIINEALQDQGCVINGDFHGMRHLVSGARIPDTPFAVCLAVSKSHMLYSLRQLLIIRINVFLLTVVATGAAFYAVSRANNTEDAPKPRRKKRVARANAPKGSWGLDDYFEQPVLPPDGK